MTISCILLAASHAPRLTLDIELDKSGSHSHLQGIPKALLPGPHGTKILDHWWRALRACEKISQVLLVTNADKFKHFERWASAVGFPLENIINDGSTLARNALGAAADLELAVRTKQLLNNDVLVIAGDMIYQVGKFELNDVLEFWESKPEGDIAVYYSMQEDELTTSRGILELDKNSRVSQFLEKPLPSATSSRCASVVFYGLRSGALQLLLPHVRQLQALPLHHRALGCFMESIINEGKRTVYGCPVSTGFQLIGDVSLSEYTRWLSVYTDRPSKPPAGPRGYTARAFARVGIMGNPSDGFYGKTIAMTIGNFWADATIEESATLRLLPHPLNDPTDFSAVASRLVCCIDPPLLRQPVRHAITSKSTTDGRASQRTLQSNLDSDAESTYLPSASETRNHQQEHHGWPRLAEKTPVKSGLRCRVHLPSVRFGSLSDLHGISTREGYLGGLRLLQATCKMFHHYCTQHNIPLSPRNFTLSYNTNIPRQVGLAGSSAIVTAAFHALLAFYAVPSDCLPPPVRPQLVLDVETRELCINAGLQDRVVQEYEGLVYMDFSRELLERDGHGRYERVVLPDTAPLPPFFLAYKPDPSDSGRIHSDVRDRWAKGDEAVVAGMAELASITDEALSTIKSADWRALGRLMSRNFSVRERLYGPACLGASNLRMVELGRQYGACVKFPGSGGAVLGLPMEDTDMEALRSHYQSEGCVVVDVIPHLLHERTLLSL